jgi:LysM repeat protein
MRALLVLVLVLASVGVPVGASGARQSPGRYVVAPGDSLSLIAERYGVSLGRLAQANSLDVRAPLLVGTVLHLPGSSSTAATAHAGWTSRYVVRPGDTLGAIADHFAVPLGELAKANGVDPAGVLLAGAKLKVPGAATAAPTAAPTGITLTVKPGDTLSGLAGRFGISIESLSSSNDLEPTAWLYVGQRLLIPAQSSSTAALLELAAAESSPYTASVAGYDISFPDCSRTLPTDAGFFIVGLNNGRPFTANPCFEIEYAAAKASGLSPSIYLNAAYAPSLIRHVTPDCASAGEAQPLGRRRRIAYAVGCSEAEASVGMLGGLPAAAIWIDIEPANTWSKRPGMNRAAIAGFAATLLTQDPRPIVGVYSSAAYWPGLTGAWSSFPLPEWLATGSPVDANGCALPFAAGRVWLSQQATTRDHDTAC